jgi:hypothetical protein
MNAQRLRVILAVTMVLIIVGAVVGFTIGQKNLADYAASISQLNADAQFGDQNIQTLQRLKTRLAAQQELIQKTRAIVGDSSTYTNDVINDISRIGAESGVAIKSITFVESSTTATPTTTTPVTGAPATTTPATSGVVKKMVTVSVDSPLSYTNLMSFLAKVESNDLRMHIARVSMTKDQGNDVATPDLTVEVYVRQ